MENKEYQYLSRVEDYLTGNMTPEQRSVFEQDIKEDAELNGYLQMTIRMDRSLKHVARKKQEFRAMIKDIRQELQEEEAEVNVADVAQLEDIYERHYTQPSMWVKFRPYLAIAASIALLIGAFWWWQNGQANNASNIARNKIQQSRQLPEENIQAFGPTENEAYEFYKSGRFEAAAAIWQRLLDEDKKDPLVSRPDPEKRYFLALCRLQQGDRQLDHAIQLLSALNEEAEQDIRNIRPITPVSVKWHLARALMENKQLAKAKNLLKEISDEYLPAKQLLEEIK